MTNSAEIQWAGRWMSSSSSAAVELAIFFHFYAVMWINISMKNQIISILMFWVEFLYVCWVLQEQNRKRFLFDICCESFEIKSLICTFALPCFFFLQRTFILLYFFWEKSVILLLRFFHVHTIWRRIKCCPLCSYQAFMWPCTYSPSFHLLNTLTPSLSCLAPVRQLTTQPPNERNTNGPLKSLETFISSKDTFSTKRLISTAGCVTVTVPERFLTLPLRSI